MLGADDLAKAITQASAGQQIAGRAIVVRTVRKPGDIGGSPQLLFIGASEREPPAGPAPSVRGPAGADRRRRDGLRSAGVVLNFYTSDTRIRFEANTTAAARAGLQISSHLLRLARIVG